MLVFGKYAITVITSPNHWQSTARTPSGREGTADSARCQLKVLTLFSGIFLSLSLTGTPVKDTLAATTRFDPSHAPVFASPGAFISLYGHRHVSRGSVLEVDIGYPLRALPAHDD